MRSPAVLGQPETEFLQEAWQNSPIAHPKALHPHSFPGRADVRGQGERAQRRAIDRLECRTLYFPPKRPPGSKGFR